MENRFDELAKTLAGAISRREVLSRLGGGLAGLLLASLGWGKAWGQNNICLHICATKTRGHCIRDCRDCLERGSTVCGVRSAGTVVCCKRCHPNSLTCIGGPG
jgi:hypothetical protein